jgi:hypothetical protein
MMVEPFPKGESMRHRVRLSAVFLLFALVATSAFAALMQHSETTIVKPEIGKRIALDRLAYKSRRFEARIPSVELQLKSAEGADPLVADWVFTSSNTDGQMHRVEMQVRLLDEAGKQIGWVVAKHPVRAAAHEEPFRVPMKVKQSVWDATRKVRIFADWLS